jgi:diguanylate cyclase (GGDEF)-like protein
MRWLREIRQYFASRADPYAGGDMANAQRLGAMLWGLVLVLMVALWPLSPPTEALGEAGWIVACAVAAGGTGLVYALWRRKLLKTWTTLLVASYLTVIGIGVMQWLTGEIDAPYHTLLLLPVGFVAAVQPPRKIAAFMAFVLLVLAAPLVYDGWDAVAAGAGGAAFVIWFALAFVFSLLMSGVRAQRLAHAREEAAAREEARVDSLTGLHNRRAFDEMLDLEVQRSRRLDVPLSVAMIDIENFKQINDRWGYGEGDRTLRELAAAMRSSVRQPDLCFRWGGDEFSVILTGTSAHDTESLGQRLRVAVREACRRPDDESVQIRFAVAELRDGMTAHELGERAGMALTAAKMGAAR